MTNQGIRSIALVSSIALATLSATSGQAQAASASSTVRGVVAAGNGVAGVEQRVDVIAPKLAGATVEVVAYSGRKSDVAYATLNAKGQGSATFTPSTSGTWIVAASGPGLSLAESRIHVDAVPTVNTIYVPNKAERFKPMDLSSMVESTDGTAFVKGKVTFYEVTRGRLGSVDVEAGPGDSHAVATFTWTPPGAGNFAFTSVFEPANDPQTGTPAVEASDSGTSYVEVQESRVLVQLLMPPVLRIGKPAFVIAQLPERYRGTVSLSVDGRAVSPDKDTVDGRAVFEWVPLHGGLTEVELELQNDRHPRLERLVTQPVYIEPRLIPNPISVSPVIDAVAGKPWADNDILDYPAGTRVTLVTSTGNGAGVTIEQLGKCMLDGATLVVPPTGGGCRVMFSSPGDARFATNGAEVLITSSVQASSARPQGS